MGHAFRFLGTGSGYAYQISIQPIQSQQIAYFSSQLHTCKSTVAAVKAGSEFSRSTLSMLKREVREGDVYIVSFAG